LLPDRSQPDTPWTLCRILLEQQAVLFAIYVPFVGPNWLPFLAAEAAIDHNSFVGTLVESSDA
jgi:hypothetical protein